MTLAAARKARDAAKLKKSDGLDPVQTRKIEKLKALTPAGNTFKATALEWYRRRWCTSLSTATDLKIKTVVV